MLLSTSHVSAHWKFSANLGNFLYEFENFNDKLHAKVFSDVAAGLAYLHDKNTAQSSLNNKEQFKLTLID